MVRLADLDGFSEEHPVLTAEEALNAALTYIDMGWAVTAGPGLDAAGTCSCKLRSKCRNPGKHPYKGWGNETRRVLTRGEAEKYWSPKNARWDEYPVDQVFIVPYLSGLVVADVDNEAGWLALPEEDRPETLTQRSGSGRGGHRIYRYEWDTSEKIPPVLPGKLRGGCGEVKFRGIIAAAPSVHPSGGRYEWLNWGAEIVDAPKSLITRDETFTRVAYDWDTIVSADRTNPMISLMFRADVAGMDSAGDASSGRPLVLFAVAASMAKWIAAEWITEDEVVSRLLTSAEKNGALDKYGSVDMERQIRNGVRAGMIEKRS